MAGGARFNDVVNALGGNDLVVIGNGKDTIFGGTGDDTIIGGTGKDVFALGFNSGSDTITDFELGLDLLDLDEAGPTELSLSDSADGLLMTGLGGTVILEGVTEDEFV